MPWCRNRASIPSGILRRGTDFPQSPPRSASLTPRPVQGTDWPRPAPRRRPILPCSLSPSVHRRACDLPHAAHTRQAILLTGGDRSLAATPQGSRAGSWAFSRMIWSSRTSRWCFFIAACPEATNRSCHWLSSCAATPNSRDSTSNPSPRSSRLTASALRPAENRYCFLGLATGALVATARRRPRRTLVRERGCCQRRLGRGTGPLVSGGHPSFQDGIIETHLIFSYTFTRGTKGATPGTGPLGSCDQTPPVGP